MFIVLPISDLEKSLYSDFPSMDLNISQIMVSA